MQLISAGLTWFLDGVYLTVRLRDTTSALLTTGDYTLVQVSYIVAECFQMELPTP